MDGKKNGKNLNMNRNINIIKNYKSNKNWRRTRKGTGFIGKYL